MHKKKVIASLAAVSLAASFALPAAAATLTPMFVTGGTAAAFAYYDLANAALKPNSADTGATCNASTEDCAVEQLYAAIGTGGAQGSFLLHAENGTTVGTGEPAYNDPTNLPGVWLTNPPTGDIDYAAGDAPLSVSQLNTYDTVPLSSGSTALATYGVADVVPTMVVPVAIAYNLPAGVSGLGAGGLQLSTAAYCGIFTGTVTMWNDPTIAASNPGATLPATQINVVVRSDGSGTTFIFSNELDQFCSNFATVTGGVGLGSGTTNTGTVAPIWGYTSPNSSGTVIPGTDFTQVKGSGGVQSYIANTAGSIGYLSTNYTLPFATTCVNSSNASIPCPSAAVVENAKLKYEAPTATTETDALKGPFLTVGPSGTANSTTTTYPNPIANQYLYLGKASNLAAYPFTGFTYGYFYECSDAKTTTTALVGAKGLFKTYIYKSEVGGALTPADTIIQSIGLLQLSNTIKANSAKIIDTGAGRIVNGPVAGTCTTPS